MEKIEKLNKQLEELTTSFNERKEIIAYNREVEGPVFTESDTEIDFFAENEKWFVFDRDLIKSKIEIEYMSLEDKDVSNSDLEIAKKTTLPVDASEPLESENKGEPENSFQKHYQYTIDFSKKVGYASGFFLTNHFLTSIGLPPIAAIKPLMIGGVKLTGMLANSMVTYCAANPATAAMVGPSIPIALKYVEKGFKNLTEKKKEDIADDSPVDPNISVVKVPPVDKPVVESHSIWDFFEIIGSITWKVLKKIHDLF